MGYKLLGWATWHGAKWFLRHKYGSTMVPAPLIAVAVVLGALGIALASRGRGEN